MMIIYGRLNLMEKAKLEFIDIPLITWLQALYQLTVVFLILFYGEKMFDIDSGRLTGEYTNKTYFTLSVDFLVVRFRR